jgi:hypothetical protein
MRFGISAICLSMVLVAGCDSPQAEGDLEHVVELHIKPGMAADFEATVNDRNARRASTGVTFLTRASANESFVYRFVTPVGDWAGLGERATQMAGLGPASPGISGNEAIDYIDSYVRLRQPELDYTPADPRLANDAWGMVQRVRLYVHQGMMDEMTAVIRDAGALYTEHGIQEPFIVTRQAMGADGPIMEVFFPAADPADLYTHAAQVEEELGEAGAALSARVAALCRRVEVSNFMIRRDLGYQPES